MASSGNIEHLGIINDVTDNQIKISIMPESACGNCRARASCSISELSEKTIKVFNPKNETYFVGEEIIVVLEQSLGMKALGLGYILPFFILLFFLILLTSIGLSEGMAGLLSLLSLAPYYFGLTLWKDNLKKEFSFRLKKYNKSSK